MNISFICSVWKRAEYEEHVLPAISKLSDDIVEVSTRTSIYEAYNRGAAMARYPVKAFIHDDVEILEPDRFHDTVESAFADPQVGMIGPIGSTNLAVVPWWHNDIKGQVRHGRGDNTHYYGNMLNGEQAEAQALDGMLLISRVDLWWPQHRCHGFHYYDMEASEIVKGLGCKLMVVDIKCHHRFRRKDRTFLPDFIEASHRFARQYPDIEVSRKDYDHIRPEDAEKIIAGAELATSQTNTVV